MRIANRFAEPKFVLEIDNSGFVNEDEYKAYQDLVLEELKKSTPDQSIIMPSGKISMVGAEGSALRLTDTIANITSQIISVSHVPASLLGIAGKGESETRQQIIVLTNLCRNLQRSICNTMTAVLGPVLSAVYGISGNIGFTFSEPRLIEAIQVEQTRKLKRENDEIDLASGLISPETYAARSMGGVVEIFDRAAFDEWTDKLRERGPQGSGKAESPRVGDQARLNDTAQQLAPSSPTDLGA
jgi:hypothetical protein